ncbi:MAG: GEVED domain-containing protein [Bacteroidota bacterium]
MLLLFAKGNPANANNIPGTFRYNDNLYESGIKPKAGPVITSFSPKFGPVGTLVNIKGHNLSGVSAAYLHNNLASLSQSGRTDTTLTIAISHGSSSGLISLSNAPFIAESADTFFVSPYPVCSNVQSNPCGFGPRLFRITLNNMVFEDGLMRCAAGTSAYTYKQAFSVPFAAGGNQFNIISPDSDATGAAWLDLDRDGLFEPEEFLSFSDGGLSLILNTAIPATATAGPCLLRIRLAAAGQSFTSGDACTTRNNGTTIDFNIYISAPCPAKPVIYAASGTTFCAGPGGQADLAVENVDPSLTYLWSNNLSGTGMRTFDGGSFTVRAVSGTCTSEASEPIVVTLRPRTQASHILNDGPTTFCEGGSVLIYTPLEFDSYLWSTGETTRSIQASRGGIYNVWVQNAGECLSDTFPGIKITIIPKEAPVQIIAAGPTTLCAGDSVRLTAPAGYAQYYWSNNKYTQSIYVKTSGRYTVRVSKVIGCLSDTFSGYSVSGVSVYPANATPDDSITVILDPAETCPTQAASPTRSMASATIARFQAGIGIDGTPWSNIVSSYAAADEARTRFTRNNAVWTKKILPRAYFGASRSTNITELDFNLNGDALVNGSYPRTGKQAPLCSDFSVPFPIPASATPNAFGVTVTVNAPMSAPQINSGGNPLIICPLSSVNLQVANPPAGYTYLWSNGASGTVISAGVLGPYSVRAVFNGCTSAVSNVLTVVGGNLPDQPEISPIGDFFICPGDTILLTATRSGGTYRWSNGLTGTSIKVTTGGSYSVLAVSPNGCSSIASTATVVTLNPRPDAVLNVNGTELVASPAGAVYEWLLDGALLSGIGTQTYLPTAPGAYQVVVSLNGCGDTSNTILISGTGSKARNAAEVQVFPNPGASTLNLLAPADFRKNVKTLQLVNNLGQTVLTVQVHADEQGLITVPVSHLPAGIYCVSIPGTGFTKTWVKE